MILSSRPSAPNAVLLLTGPQPAGVWNGHLYPAWAGFNPVDEQTIWNTLAAAYAPWQFDITTDPTTTKPHSTIGFCPLFGGYPVSGGQADENSFNLPGVGAFVFVDMLGWNAQLIALDAVHETGHTINLQHVMNPDGTYENGFWMGNPFIGTPVFTQDQKTYLDTRFGVEADLDRNGKVDYADALLLQALGSPTQVEALNLIRNIGKAG